jgi:hypothetical protein
MDLTCFWMRADPARSGGAKNVFNVAGMLSAGMASRVVTIGKIGGFCDPNAG